MEAYALLSASALKRRPALATFNVRISKASTLLGSIVASVVIQMSSRAPERVRKHDQTGNRPEDGVRAGPARNLTGDLAGGMKNGIRTGIVIVAQA